MPDDLSTTHSEAGADSERAQPEAPAHFDVFLSHNGRDKPAVEHLARRLRQGGLEPWLDAWQLPGGGHWQEQLSEGIYASSACAVFVGPDGMGNWEREELAIALNRAVVDREFRVFTVLLPGVSEPFDDNILPPNLRIRTWVDLRGGIDDRRGLQGLINAIVGVPIGPDQGARPDPGVCPYRGLEVFDQEHADFFFGRDGEIQRLVERLKETRFIAVLGPSGTGKSSLVRAGLVPAIHHGRLPGSERWNVRVFRPGARPLTQLAAELVRLDAGSGMHETVDGLARDPRTLDLAAALALVDGTPADRVVWVVDQFEEVFTLSRDDAERAAFFDNLLYAASAPGGRSVVILTLRADFYPHCAMFPELAAEVAREQFLVSPMSPEGLRQAIVEPARLVDLEFEEGLVATILDDVLGQPGGLPLLEHALLELWRRRRGSMLTLEGYRDSGGVQGAIAARADSLFSSLEPEQQAIARRVLLRLTEPGEGTEDTRRRAGLLELATRTDEVGDLEGVVNAFVAERLLTTSIDAGSGAREVDVSHEALIRAWPRLRAWIDEDRAGLREHRRLTEAAQDWQLHDRDDGLLYRGARLAAALEWRARNDAVLNDLEREFLDAGRALRDRDRIARRRRVQVALSGLSVALIVISALAFVAFRRGEDAARERDNAFRLGEEVATERDNALREAEARRTAEAQANRDREQAENIAKVAQSRELGTYALTLLDVDPELSVLLSSAALELEPTDQAQTALTLGLARMHTRAVLSHDDDVWTAAFSPDGRYVVSASVDKTIAIWDWSSRTMVISRRLSDAGVHSAYFNPSGTHVVAATADGVAWIWDWNTDTVEALGTAGAELNEAVFSPDGTLVATVDDVGTIRVWDWAAGQEIATAQGSGNTGWAVAFSPDGTAIVTGESDGTVKTWEWQSQSEPTTFHVHDGAVFDLAISPNGGQLVTGGEDGYVNIWQRTRSGWDESNGLYLGHAGERVLGVDISPDGDWAMSTSSSGDVRIWRIASYGASGAYQLTGHTDAVLGARFSPDGVYVVTASEDNTLRVSEWRQLHFVASIHANDQSVLSVEISADGRAVAVVGGDNVVRVWRWGAWDSPVTHTEHKESVYGLAFSPDGRLVATSSNDDSVVVWDWESGEVRARLADTGADQEAVDFSPDGTLIAASGEDGTVRIWDWQAGATVTTLARSESAVRAVAFSPDGRLLAAGADDGTIVVWDRDQESAVAEMSANDNGVMKVAFSSDGDYLLSAGWDQQVHVWEWERSATVADLHDHASVVWDATFTPSGDGIVSVDDAGKLRLWRWTSPAAASVQLLGETTAPLVPLDVDADDLNTIALSPDGTYVVTGGADSHIRVYECRMCGPSEELLELARSRVQRELTSQERALYLHETTEPSS